MKETLAKQRTLLIVDDEEGPRLSLRIIFKDEYNVLTAANGEEALDIIKSHLVDAAILDIRMSGMSGTELLEEIKKYDSGIEVIMLTAYETVDSARKALRLGACDYLNKPFDISTMRTAVANAMERRNLLEEIRSNNQKLQELQVEIHNQRLQEEMMRTKGQIYASIIHDINGPLTIISGFIEVINQRLANRRYIEGEDLDIIRDRLARITRQVTNCIGISRRYLSLLRDKPPECSGVYANPLMDDVLELIKAHPLGKEHNLAIDYLENDMVISANGTDLLQILLNLALNALQCSDEPHTVRIKGQTVEQPLDLDQMVDGPQDRFVKATEFSNHPPMVAITVEDDGPGIPPDVISNLFEPYFTTKSSDKGTGLGLTIVQRLLKEAGGLLHLHSEPGKGTSFTLYFSTGA